MPEETVVGVLYNLVRRKGFLGMGREVYNVVLTDRRLIFAHLTSQMIKDAAQKAREEAKQNGDSLWKKMWSTATAGYSLYQKYPSMPVETILSETTGNFALDPAQITKVKYKQGFQDENSTSPDILILKWGEGQIKLQTQSGSVSLRDAKNLLSQAYGERFR